MTNALDEPGELSPAMAEISQRYRAWVDRRNFAVHGVRSRDESGKITDQIIKWRKHKKSKPSDVVVDVQEQDFYRLALVWHTYCILNHNAWRIALCISPSESPKNTLRTLPTSTSVSESERLPPA